MRKINLLSVVVPCHNEMEVLPSTHARLQKILESLCQSGKCSAYELVYVDNGSTDDTLSVLEKIYAENASVRIVALRRNFGYQGSLSAGLVFAKGDAVVTIDADLQDPPEKIADMILHYESGFDLVLGVREDRSSDSFVKRFFAENYYRLLKSMGVDIVHNHGDFRLMARPLVDEFNQLLERNRFIRGMILQLDSRYKTVSYARDPRMKGKTKFNLHSIFSLGIDGIISFSYLPLRLFSILGVVISFFSLLGLAYVLYGKFVLHALPGWTSTLLPIFTFGGLQLLALGVIGEYLGRLYVEVKRRPIFIVRREYGKGEVHVKREVA
ncbi:MAG: glycosyltransferase family 2 protein [Deltaproteobacteria bacterium]|nr:glycosyltransferase family 2 protein [Deltaproteobacteria bacterium]